MNSLPADEIPADEIETLADLKLAATRCTRCDLFRNATQVVVGEGRPGAPLMLVGEQPGDQEDLAGRPFIGPAGRLLDRALGDAGIDRDEAFVTNAVKHFKFAPRGKRRMHKSPNSYEIDRCRWWLDLERAIVQPAVVVALGVTAARSLFRRPKTISKERGRLLQLPEGGDCVITVHPSSLLRVPSKEARQSQYDLFIADLAVANEALSDRRASAPAGSPGGID